jgi:hypothetical protein
MEGNVKIGVCSERQAHHVGRAAAVAGGWLAVDSREGDALQALCWGDDYRHPPRYLVWPTDFGDRAPVDASAALAAAERDGLCELVEWIRSLIEG